MTLTTRVRFTGPVDPRAVWDYARELINAPDNYAWHSSVTSNPNPSRLADPDQGADALIWMEYGHEGSLLIEE